MGSGRRYYLSHKHISGRYDCFYYSPSLRGLLCMPCLLFARDGAGRGHQPIGKQVTEPLTNFKKLTGRDSYLDTHLTRNYHDNAVTSMKDLVNSKESGDVTSMLCSQHAKQVQRNRAILRAVIHEIETCGRLNLALRGHRDSGPIVPADGPECIDYGQGNLRAFLQKAALNNPVLADHLQRGPKNASYISAETQNHLISCIGSVMFKAISCEIQASSYFAIQADETSDVSKTEQLTFVVRYVDSNFNICEGFTGFIEADRTTGAAISEAILSYISKLGLNLQHMVAQSFDGASNMSGRFNGVQAMIREQCPAASYVHCFSHCLNLVLNNASAVPEISSAGAAVLAACNFFKNSPQRIKLLQQSVESISPDSRRTRLKQLCMTRWVERHDSFFVFVELFKPLLHTLTTSNEFGIVHTITEPSFLAAVHILQRVLGLTRGLSVALQSKQMNYISAMSEVDSVVSTLQQWRSDDDDEEFSTVFDAAELMYADVETLPDARIPLPRLTQRQRNRNNVPAVSAKEYYKRAVWYPFLDAVLGEMRQRFNSHSNAAMKMASVIPANCINATFASLEPSIDVYGALLPDGTEAIRNEFHRWQRKWHASAPDQRPSSLTATLSCCDSSMYPNIAKLAEIYATIPVTTATAERSFSQLRLLKNYLRSTMKEDRLNGLALMAIRKDISLSYDEVIDQYALDYNPRMRFS